VFCRNVMIYFDGPTQRKVLERIHRAMKPGGLLYVGHSENFTDSSRPVPPARQDHLRARLTARPSLQPPL
jgi:chemotaxis methyl-accepting protein methylase